MIKCIIDKNSSACFKCEHKIAACSFSFPDPCGPLSPCGTHTLTTKPLTQGPDIPKEEKICSSQGPAEFAKEKGEDSRLHIRYTCPCAADVLEMCKRKEVQAWNEKRDEDQVGRRN